MRLIAAASVQFAACLLVQAILPPRIAAQVAVAEVPAYRIEPERRPLFGTAGVVGLNALLGGVSVGLVRELRGGSFWDGFRGGAAAGGLVFAGKAVAAQKFDGAGLAGRQLAAIGGSIGSNVALGAAPLSRLELPLGPVRVVLDDGARQVGLRVDPLGLAVIGYAALEPGLRLDAGASLSAGTAVFRSREPFLTPPMASSRAAAYELHSVIVLADLSHFDAETRADVFAHERVHTLQADAFQAFWGRALLEWIAPDTPGWQRAVGALDINLGDISAELADHLFLRGMWEIEADYLGRR